MFGTFSVSKVHNQAFGSRRRPIRRAVIFFKIRGGNFATEGGYVWFSRLDKWKGTAANAMLASAHFVALAAKRGLMLQPNARP